MEPEQEFADELHTATAAFESVQRKAPSQPWLVFWLIAKILERLKHRHANGLGFTAGPPRPQKGRPR